MQSTLSGPSCSMAQLTTRVRAAATRGICSCEMQVALTGIINEQGEGSQYWPLWMWLFPYEWELFRTLTGPRIMAAYVLSHAKLLILSLFLQPCPLLG